MSSGSCFSSNRLPRLVNLPLKKLRRYLHCKMKIKSCFGRKKFLRPWQAWHLINFFTHLLFPLKISSNNLMYHIQQLHNLSNSLFLSGYSKKLLEKREQNDLCIQNTLQFFLKAQNLYREIVNVNQINSQKIKDHNWPN